MLSRVAVIMCTWKRINKLPYTIEQLEKQNNKKFDLFIWNNNKDEIDSINNIINNKLIKISLHNSLENIGGIGRFFFAKKICNEYDKIIFIDDDQIFNERMIDIFIQNYDNNSIKSRWSWIFNSTNYSNRTKINDGGKKVHYCGTGGMITPSWIFKYDRIFEIPKKFQFIEDLWLSFVCHHHLNMNLISIEDNGFIKQVVDGKDQYVALMGLKNEFMNYLLNIEKWNLH